MNVEHERRVQDLLLAALEVPEQARREKLESLAGGEPEILAEVLDLLGRQASLGDFLERPAAFTHNDGPSAPPTRVGSYTLLELLGVGGMGQVFRARQEEPVRRQVAMKLMQAHLHGSAGERFVAEQRALARLAHSNVARFYEAGTTDDGRPFFAMELVDGVPLTDYCDRHRLPIRRRLEIFVAVCAGVEHAHQRQLLHRDLKPSNVLVTLEDGRPVPKVIDFGIAKALDGSLGDLQTRGLLLGTPAYMSPEVLLSAGRSEAEIDTRTDVYSLGVMLFELLTGRRPFADDGQPGAVLRRIEAGETKTPSGRLRLLPADELAGVAALRSTTPAEHRSLVAGDLDWIVAKAIAADRSERYGSVGELVADVGRYLRDEPVEARPPSFGYRSRKLIQRHRLAAAAIAVAVAGLVLGSVGLALGLVRARAQTAAAEAALTEAREVTSFLVDLFRAGNPNQPGSPEVTVESLLGQGVAELRDRLKDQPVARGRLLQAIADVYVQLGAYDQAEPMLVEATELFAASLSPEDPAHASALSSLGVLQIKRSEFEPALETLAAALERLDPAGDAEAWALARHNQGVALFRLRRLGAAQRAFEQAREARERHLGADHPHLARSDNALGALLLEKNRPGDALDYLRRSAEHRRRHLGAEHPSYAKSLHNVALAHLRLGGGKAGLDAARQALDIEQRSLGPDHPDLLRTLCTLGELSQLAGDGEGAEAAYRQALALAEQLFGPEHERLGQIATRLAGFYFEQGRLDEAEQLFERARPIYEWSYRPERPGSQDALAGLGLVAWKRGDLRRAEALLTEVQSHRERSLDAGDWRLAVALRGLAGVRWARGERAEAEDLACRAVRIFEASTPAPRAFEIGLRRELAARLQELGRAADAEVARRRGSGFCDR